VTGAVVERLTAGAEAGSVDVSIVILTQRRPGPLALAVRSALAQTAAEIASLELVVVDNDATPSARAGLAILAADAPFPVRYVHEPASGVANARNAAVAAARGGFIAFLDDDEEAPGGWLAALVEAQAWFDADVVFGPVVARLPDVIRRHRSYLQRFFSRVGPTQAGLLPHYFGCGDSLLRRAALPCSAPFAASANETGGEDDRLFRAMRAAGARFAWAPDAWVWEDPSPERLTLGYTIRRAFAFAQGVTWMCAQGPRPDWLAVVGWMTVGLGQATIFGFAAAGAWLIGAPQRAALTDRAARGLGKVFWGARFQIQFYGLTTAPSGSRGGALSKAPGLDSEAEPRWPGMTASPSSTTRTAARRATCSQPSRTPAASPTSSST
jgi:succinoglycan biosynthesis protein ExoM